MKFQNRFTISILSTSSLKFSKRETPDLCCTVDPRERPSVGDAPEPQIVGTAKDRAIRRRRRPSKSRPNVALHS